MAPSLTLSHYAEVPSFCIGEDDLELLRKKSKDATQPGPVCYAVGDRIFMPVSPDDIDDKLTEFEEAEFTYGFITLYNNACEAGIRLICFGTFGSYADLATSYVTRQDHDLLEKPEQPEGFRVYAYEYGWFIIIDPLTVVEMDTKLIRLYDHAAQQRATLLRIDVDGDEQPYPEHEWYFPALEIDRPCHHLIG